MDTGVSDPGERLWAALSSPGRRGDGQSSGTGILPARTVRADGVGLPSIDGPQLRVRPGGGAHIQLASDADPVLVPASRAASLIAVTT